jgi:hypothetical protein
MSAHYIKLDQAGGLVALFSCVAAQWALERNTYVLERSYVLGTLSGVGVSPDSNR